MHEQQAAAGQEPLGPARGGRGRHAGGQGQGHPQARLVVANPGCVEQQPGQPPGDHRGTAGDQTSQRVQPALPAGTVGEQPGGRVHRVDAFAHRPFGRLVQGRHRGRQPRADPGDHLGGNLAQPGRVGTAHVAVPGRADQGRQRRHQMRHVGVERGAVPDRREHGGQGIA